MSILPEVQAFNEAAAAFEEHQKQASELNFDLKIAERTGDEEKVAAAKTAIAEHSRPWHGMYQERPKLLSAALKAVGLNEESVQRAVKGY